MADSQHNPFQSPQADISDSQSSPTPDSSPPDRPRGDAYAAWRLMNYRRFAVSWFAMTISRQIESVAITVYIGVYVYAQAKDKAAALGILGLVQALPAMLLAIPGGQLADHLDRRSVLAATLGVTSLIAAGLSAACFFHTAIYWIYLLLIFNSVCQALGAPSRTALLPWIVPPEHFSNAVSWNTTIFRVGSMLGPALGGLVMALSADYGVTIALGLVFAGRLFALAGIVSLPMHRPESRQSSISLESLVAGIRFVFRHKMILATISLDLFAVLLGGATYLLPVFALDILHFPKEDVGLIVGLLSSAEAVGAIAMAVAIAHLPPIRRPGWTMLQAVAGFGVATIVFGLSRNIWLALAAMFVIGALDNVSVVIRHTLIQMLTPDDMRGRVSAVNNVFIVASNDLGGLESGLTAQFFGTIPSIVGGGIGTLLVVVGCAWIWPEILSIGSLADLRPEDTAQAIAESDEEIAARE
jgi:MFS family permease